MINDIEIDLQVDDAHPYKCGPDEALAIACREDDIEDAIDYICQWEFRNTLTHHDEEWCFGSLVISLIKYWQVIHKNNIDLTFKKCDNEALNKIKKLIKTKVLINYRNLRKQAIEYRDTMEKYNKI